MLQHTKTHDYPRVSNIICWVYVGLCNTLQHTATHYNKLKHNARLFTILKSDLFSVYRARHITATHCNTLQHTAARCNTLQHTKMHDYQRVSNSICWVYVGLCNTLQHTATHCNTMHDYPQFSKVICWVYTGLFTSLQHTATRCNTLQHTATH